MQVVVRCLCLRLLSLNSVGIYCQPVPERFPRTSRRSRWNLAPPRSRLLNKVFLEERGVVAPCPQIRWQGSSSGGPPLPLHPFRSHLQGLLQVEVKVHSVVAGPLAACARWQTALWQHCRLQDPKTRSSTGAGRPPRSSSCSGFLMTWQPALLRSLMRLPWRWRAVVCVCSALSWRSTRSSSARVPSMQTLRLPWIRRHTFTPCLQHSLIAGVGRSGAGCAC